MSGGFFIFLFTHCSQADCELFVYFVFCLLFRGYFSKSLLAGKSFESFAVKICCSFYDDLGFCSMVCFICVGSSLVWCPYMKF